MSFYHKQGYKFTIRPEMLQFMPEMQKQSAARSLSTAADGL